MKTISVKTSELEGAALDWAVAKAVGQDFTSFPWIKTDLLCDRTGEWIEDQWSPSTDWAQGGPLLDAHACHMEQYPLAKNEPWVVWVRDDKAGECGDTLLIAAMRAIGAAELGDTADIPEELAK